MGNTCGCVDPAEKGSEVEVPKNNQHRQEQINKYRDSTISQKYVGNNHHVNPTG